MQDSCGIRLYIGGKGYSNECLLNTADFINVIFINRAAEMAASLTCRNNGKYLLGTLDIYGQLSCTSPIDDILSGQAIDGDGYLYNDALKLCRVFEENQRRE